MGVGDGGSGRRVLPHHRLYRRDFAMVDDSHVLVLVLVHPGRRQKPA
ncbi:hypothetical protein AW27_034250 (plasmid) [Streptomyces sp. PCS3-D2]|nr:hypothetical protein [Streptomyces sp. PCS3-D2]WKV76613.1 hypothetical protein AW27_034250 [Streptomyces sp. PCS3-D2]